MDKEFSSEEVAKFTASREETDSEAKRDADSMNSEKPNSKVDPMTVLELQAREMDRDEILEQMRNDPGFSSPIREQDKALLPEKEKALLAKNDKATLALLETYQKFCDQKGEKMPEHSAEHLKRLREKYPNGK